MKLHLEQTRRNTTLSVYFGDLNQSYLKCMASNKLEEGITFVRQCYIEDMKQAAQLQEQIQAYWDISDIMDVRRRMQDVYSCMQKKFPAPLRRTRIHDNTSFFSIDRNV